MIPLLQATYTVCRLLEAIAQCGEDEAIRQLADTAKVTLTDLIAHLASQLLRLHAASCHEGLLPLANLLAHLLGAPSTPPPASDTPEEVAVSPTVLLIGEAGEGLFAKCMEACLSIVEEVYVMWNKKENVRRIAPPPPPFNAFFPSSFSGSWARTCRQARGQQRQRQLRPLVD